MRPFGAGKRAAAAAAVAETAAVDETRVVGEAEHAGARVAVEVGGSLRWVNAAATVAGERGA